MPREGPNSTAKEQSGLGFSYGAGSRKYTDTPTTIVANNVLDIYTGDTTYLTGALLNSKAGKLKLDTGNFVFDNYNDKDHQKNIAAQLGINIADPLASTIGGSYYYRNKEGITYATVGAGEIKVRNNPRQSLIALNRDPANLQRVIKDKTIDIKIPGLQLRAIVEAGKAVESVVKQMHDLLASLGPDAANTATGIMRLGGPKDGIAYEKWVRNLIASDKLNALGKAGQTLREALAEQGDLDKISEEKKEEIRVAFFQACAVPPATAVCSAGASATFNLIAAAVIMMTQPESPPPIRTDENGRKYYTYDDIRKLGSGIWFSDGNGRYYQNSADVPTAVATSPGDGTGNCTVTCRVDIKVWRNG